MTTEQGKTTKALQYAIQMEIDGKTFYLKCSRESGNELGKKLMDSLAAQEDYHRQKFEQIFENLGKAHKWPAVQFKPDGGKTLRTIFSVETNKPASEIKVLQTELDAIQKAMDMEDKSYDLYQDRFEHASAGAEKEYYEKIATEEREHKLVLLDYFEFLKNPAAWFVQKEKPLLEI